VDAGLDPARVDQVLASDEFREAVEADVAQALAFGAGGVPFFVVDRKYGVSGAQPTEVFTQVLDQAWAASLPALTMVDGEGDVCGPEGCQV
jgi:predicted DsbA family dithiol-disulfide isomerase